MPKVDLRPKKDEEVKEPEAKAEEVEVDQTDTSTVEEPSEDPVEETEKSEEAGAPADEQKSDDNQLVGLQSEKEKLLNDIKNLRLERRRAREEKQVFVEEKPKQAPTLEGVSQADVDLVRKILAAEGVVKKDELSSMTYREKLDTHKDSWLKAHPEYLPENDPDDKMWSKLNESINSYFKVPTNPADITRILDLANEMVNPKASIPVKSMATTQAKQEKLSSSSKGISGTSKSPVNRSKVSVSHEYLKGFSDEELREFNS